MPRPRSASARPPRYLLAPSALLYESQRQAAGLDAVSDEAKITYQIILGFAWVNKYQFTPALTRRAIAIERGLDERTISRHIAELEAAHYLSIQPGSGQASTYIPLITYQNDTASTQPQPTAHSPADEADTQPTAAPHSHSSQPAPHSPAQADPQPEPLTRMSRVSDQPLSPMSRVASEQEAKGPMNSGDPSQVSRVPININSCSSSLTSSDLNSEEQLQRHIINLLTGTFGVLPKAAQDMVATSSIADLLGWLHALIEAQVPTDRLPRLLVANLLRDHRPAPPAPPELRKTRAEREAAWGISAEITAPDADGQGDADLDFLADLLGVPHQAALDALWSARAAGWGPRFTQYQILKWGLYASMPNAGSIGNPAHFVAAKIRQTAECPDLPLWKCESHRNRTRLVEADPIWEQWKREHLGELKTLTRLDRQLSEVDGTNQDEHDEAERELEY